MRGSAALLAALLASCGREPEPQAPAPASGAPAKTSQVAPASQRDPPQGDRPATLEPAPRLFPDQMPQVDDAVRAEFSRKQASLEEWPEEHLHDRARPVLQALLESLAAGGPIGAHFATDARGLTDLRPPGLSSTFKDAACELAAPPEAWYGEAPLHQDHEVAARALRAVFPERAPGVRLHIVRVLLLEDGGFQTEALVELDDLAPAPRQVRARWRVEWAPPAAQEPPRIRELRTLRYSEGHGSRAFLAEVTPRAFGGNRAYDVHLMRGVDQHYGRVDRQAGVSYQGMQGLAVGDINNDGLEDVYVCQQVGVPNALFVRRPDGSFQDIAAEAKVDFLDITRSALIVDLDNDGNRDIVQAIGPSLVVAYNDGSMRFQRQLQLRAEGEEQFYSLAAADPDQDGDLDLYGCRYALGGVMHGAPTPYADANNGASNHYFRNEGFGRFTNATVEVGLDANNRKFSLSALWEDFDGDGHLDLYVVNDFGRNNLYRNDGQGRFADVAAESGVDDVGAGMGATCADFDLDGKVDLYVTNMWSAAGLRIARQDERFMGGQHHQMHPLYIKHASGNTLLKNLGGGRFEDVTADAGVGQGGWAWGSVFLDFQADGLPDLYVPNGQTTNPSGDFDLESYFWRRVVSQSPPDTQASEAYKNAFEAIQHLMMFENLAWNGRERNVTFLNTGGGRFADVSGLGGAAFLDDARCASVLDWDDDGRADLLLKNRTGPALRLMHNRDRSPNAFASFELAGTRSNRDAIGARVVLEAGGVRRVRRVYAGEGYLAQSSRRLLFGLGSATRIERARVEWPDGSVESFADLAVNTRYLIVQGSGKAEVRKGHLVADAHAQPGAAVQAPHNPLARVVLAEKLPAEPLALPGFAAPARTLADLAGKQVLLVLWTAEHGAGEQALAALAGLREELSAVPLEVLPLSTDEGAALTRARRTGERLGYGATAGYLDGRASDALQVLLVEVLGFFRDVQQPTAFLVDARGRIVALYVGRIDAAEVLADARTLASMPAHLLTTMKLSGGRYLTPRKRDLETLAQVFAGMGNETLSNYYARLASAAGTPR